MFVAFIISEPFHLRPHYLDGNFASLCKVLWSLLAGTSVYLQGFVCSRFSILLVVCLCLPPKETMLLKKGKL
jgi:hypothetical protein